MAPRLLEFLNNKKWALEDLPFCAAVFRTTSFRSVVAQSSRWVVLLALSRPPSVSFFLLVLLGFFSLVCLANTDSTLLAPKNLYTLYYIFFWFWFGRCTANLFLAFHWPLLLALGGLFVGELELDEDLSGCLQIWQFQVMVLFKHVLKEILSHVKMDMIWNESAKNGKRSTIDNDMSTYGTVCICRITMYLYRLVFGPVKLGVLAGCSLWKHLDKQR